MIVMVRILLTLMGGRHDNKPYHPIDNREGVIQMGLAENQLCFDLIQKWIRRNPKASICTAKGVHEFKNIAIFQDYHGFKEFRQAVTNFIHKARGGRVTFDPSRIVMSGGATGANEIVMSCDAFLVPSPCYPVFPREGLISNLIFCETHLDDSFTIIHRVI
ncbi:hypothetical protein RGQ29_023600 [Quercus rubra]|uniref:Aminotransferase class I/classII large domain-containing protein n=1 Tax=Quercus rubra TaxID=3512 RepID=A0AAN7F6M3_QUERU|nr:hypothetical protein RGQ29_023600 [Quercus rubra]